MGKLPSASASSEEAIIPIIEAIKSFLDILYAREE